MSGCARLTPLVILVQAACSGGLLSLASSTTVDFRLELASKGLYLANSLLKNVAYQLIFRWVLEYPPPPPPPPPPPHTHTHTHTSCHPDHALTITTSGESLQVGIDASKNLQDFVGTRKASKTTAVILLQVHAWN